MKWRFIQLSEYRYVYKGEGFELYYEKEDIITIVDVKTCGRRVDIPAYIEDKPVGTIGKKAFLGRKLLNYVVIPETVAVIEDWAFAHCTALEHVAIMRSGYTDIGNGVFQDCNRLQRISIGCDEYNDLSCILATLPCRLKAEYMFFDNAIGTSAWYDKWDKALNTFLQENDEEGYTNLVLCGEEDIARSVPGYIEDKRKRKSALCLIRLLHSEHLSRRYEDIYRHYIINHIKGCESDSAWQALLEEFGDDMEYFRLFADIGGITSDNLDSMIADMDDSHPETKTYLLNYRQEHFQNVDVFSAFSL
jgi:hypothetical protein